MPIMVFTGYISLTEFVFYYFLLTPPVLLFVNFISRIQKNEEKSGLVFSEKGIRFYNANDVEFDISWSNLVIQKRVGPNRFITEFIFKNSDYTIKSYSQLIYWPNEISYIELVKKYLSKDHDFYKMVEEHSKKRGLKF
jgi:hypothetical protein